MRMHHHLAGCLLISLLVTVGCDDRRPVGAMPTGEALPAVPMQGAGGAGGSWRDIYSADLYRFVPVAGLELVVPITWEPQEPSSSMRAAQFGIPAVDGSGPAELAVFYFGAGEGGSAAANLDRWLGQLQNPRDVDRAAARANGLQFALMRGNGKWAPGPMPGMPAIEPIEDAGLVGIVIEGGPQGSVFLRLVGPSDTMAEVSTELDALIRGAHVAGSSPGADAPRPMRGPQPPATGGGNAMTKIAAPDGFQAFNAAGVELVVPADWVAQPPDNGMRLGQFAIAGNVDAVVYYFGEGQGGSAAANLERWLGQLTNAHDVQRDAKQVNGLTVSTLRAAGAFAPSAMPGAPAADPIADARMVGVVVEGGAHGTVFVKFVGPRESVDAIAAAIDTMIANLRPH